MGVILICFLRLITVGMQVGRSVGTAEIGAIVGLFDLVVVIVGSIVLGSTGG